MSIRLGDRVTDIISGFRGIAWCRVTYLTSPDQIGVMPASEDNKPGEVYYMDEDRLMAGSVSELQKLKYGE